MLQPQLLEKLKGCLRVISNAQFFTFKTFANQQHKSNTVDFFKYINRRSVSTDEITSIRRYSIVSKLKLLCFSKWNRKLQGGC